MDSMRAWLRVPEGLGLPRWATAGLCASVAGELEARSGAALERVVFGIVDLETTGLSPAHCRILEIGLVAVQGGRVLGTFGTLVDVGGPVPSGITALTGIDDALLEGAPCEGDALDAMAGFMAEHRVDVLVAHNARFDRGFLARAWREHGREPALPEFLCTVRLARKLVRAPRYGLDALVTHLSIPERARHRALGDAEMTADLFVELLARARLAGVHTLERLRKIGELKRTPPARARSRVRVVESAV
jgi:DNA polymerase-3 subunit epsilon